MTRSALTFASMAVTVMIGLTAPAAQAEQCPPVLPDTERLSALLDQVQKAPDAQTAQLLSAQLWKVWATAPDAYAQELLDEGMDRRAAFDLDKAIAAFDALIAYCPTYAEGYNQRAFALFIKQDFARALQDLDAALERSPRHVAALAGRGLTYMGLGNNTEALRDLKAALALNPWIPERGLVPQLEQALGSEDL